MIELICNKALIERLYPGPSLQKKWNIYKGIQCSDDSFPEKGGRSVASVVLMKVITYCLFLLTAFSQLTTRRNCVSSCTAFFFLFSFTVFQSNTASNRPEELHLMNCVVDRFCMPFMVLLIAVLYEVLHPHHSCFSWWLYLLAAFVYSALPHLQRMCFLWMPYYLFFFFALDLPCMTLATLSLVLAFFFFSMTFNNGVALCSICGQCRQCSQAALLSSSPFANFVLHFSLVEASVSHHGQECIV